MSEMCRNLSDSRRWAWVLAMAVAAAAGPVAAEDGSGVAAASDPTADVTVDLRADKSQFQINHAKDGRDSLELSAELNGRLVSDDLTGAAFQFDIADYRFAGVLGKGEKYKTPSKTAPQFSLSVKRKKGVLDVKLGKAALARAFQAYGALAMKVVKPGIPVVVPMTLTLAGSQVRFSVEYDYVGSEKSGKGKFKWGGKEGEQGTGLLLFNRVQVVELEDGGEHSFVLQGYLQRPNADEIVRATEGNWVIGIGGYVQTIPVGEMNAAGKTRIRFSSPAKTPGIKSFDLNTKKGTFSITTRDVQATGAEGAASGFPLTGAPLLRTTFAVSVALDLKDGGSFVASTVVWVKRKNIGIPKWTGLFRPKGKSKDKPFDMPGTPFF